MKKIKRIGALLLMLVMVFSMSTVAFAAEVEDTRAEVVTNQTRGAELLYGKSAYIADGRGEFEFTMSSAEWGVDFVVFVDGDPTVQYNIAIITPSRKELNLGAIYGNGETVRLNRWYTEAGEYTVRVTAGNYSMPITVMVQVFG